MLLSPACASLDMFRDYAHRGAVFAASVQGARRMSASSASLMGFARSTAKNGAVHLDAVTIALALGIVLLGLIMVTSASVSIAGQETASRSSTSSASCC